MRLPTFVSGRGRCPSGSTPARTTTIEAQFAPSGFFVEVETWDVPVGAANSSSDGLGRDVASEVNITLRPYVLRAFTDRENTNTNDVAHIVSLTIDGVRLECVSQATVTKRVSTLQASSGSRQFPTRPKFNDPDETQRWGEWQRALFENPQPVLTITTPAFRDDAHLTAALERDISHRVSVRLRGKTQVGVEQHFLT